MIDIVLGIILLCYVVKGVRRGYVRSLYHAINVLIAAFCAFGVYPVVGLILTRTPLKAFFAKMGYENFVKHINGNVAVEEYVKNFNSIFTRGATTLETTEEAAKVIAENMGTMACKAIAYLLVFFLLIFVVNDFLNRIKYLNKIRRNMPVFNGLAGIALGGLRGVVILSVVFAVLEVLVPIFNNGFLNKFVQSRFDFIFIFKNTIVDVLSRITYYNNI